jgi:hypothetical protein
MLCPCSFYTKLGSSKDKHTSLFLMGFNAESMSLTTLQQRKDDNKAHLSYLFLTRQKRLTKDKHFTLLYILK